MKRGIIYIISVALVITSCMKDDMLWDLPEIQRNPNSGVFIVNEGNFTYGNASLSFYDYETGEVLQDVFFNSNGIPLGDVAQSMTIRDSLGYVVINNSGKIVVFNTNTYAYHGKITDFTSPRYIYFLNDARAYVTDLYARKISIVDTKNNSITGGINVSNGKSAYYQHPTEQMVQYDKFIFTNCWSFDDQILVIDSEKNELVDSISVLKQPSSLVIDKYNKIWVIADGGLEGSSFGRETPGLIKINAITREIERIIRFEENDYPGEIRINGSADTIYFINRHLYRMPVHSELNPELFIQSSYSGNFSGGFYSIGIDPYNSEIFIADAIDHVQKGVVYRYKSDGTPLDTFKVGVNPGYFCFK